jgi:predicted nuclease of predicted toxin-antitoxin system
VHVRELGLATAPDEDILDRAVVEDRIVISADTDFGYLLRAGRRTAPSVILLREPKATPRQRLELLLRVLRQHAGALTTGALVVARRSGEPRVRPLPLEVSGGR